MAKLRDDELSLDQRQADLLQQLVRFNTSNPQSTKPNVLAGSITC